MANIDKNLKTRACIFDFDGVVVDSEKYHHRAWQQIANILNVPFDYDEYAPFKSAGREKVIPYLFGKAGKTLTQNEFCKFSQLRDRYAKTALAQISSQDIMPGFVEFARHLQANGVAMGVASASTSSHVVAERLQIFRLFDAFVDGEAHLPHKPNPDMFLEVARQLGVTPDECIVFEDSINGLQGALNANMRVIGIQSSFTDIAPTIDNFENLTLRKAEELCTTKFQR